MYSSKIFMDRAKNKDSEVKKIPTEEDFFVSVVEMEKHLNQIARALWVIAKGNGR